MKLPNSFDKFLEERVNLNKTRVEQAEAAFETLTSFLSNHDDIGEILIDTFKQGSLRQGTIIRPRTDETEYDVDLLVRLEAVNGRSATDYLDAVHAAFKGSERYSEIVDRRGKHRCVTIDYATHDFHVDVVPSIEANDQCWIMNRDTDQFEVTDGDGYAAWFAKRSAIAGGKTLAKVVRLVKYLRDEHEWPVKSVLLTTLLGRQVLDSDASNRYEDIPTALWTVMNRLDAWLQAQPSMPTVSNPALPAEKFNRHLDKDAFIAFRAGVQKAVTGIRAALVSPDAEASLDLWRVVFGDAFPLADEDLVAKSVALATIPPVGSISHARPLSDIASSLAVSARVRVDAWVYNSDGTRRFRGINSGTNIVSGRAIGFRAWTDATEPFDVFWQVVNTGAHAASEGGLRGEFRTGRTLKNQPARKLINWETTKYTGRHWIECFIVRHEVCIGRSGRFYVNIKNPAF